jgi:translocation and assembly module TamB
MTWKPEMDELRRRQELARRMGGADKVKRQHDGGKLTVRERVERLFGITRFRVDPGLNGVTATGSGQNATARITVEQQVTRNLTVLYESNVNSTQQQVIQVEYIVNRNVSVVALLDQNGTFGIDVKIKKRLP